MLVRGGASSEEINAPEKQTSSAMATRAFMSGVPRSFICFSMASACTGSSILFSTIRSALERFLSGSLMRPSGSILAFRKGSEALMMAILSSLWIWRCWNASSRMITEGILAAKCFTRYFTASFLFFATMTMASGLFQASIAVSSPDSLLLSRTFCPSETSCTPFDSLRYPREMMAGLQPMER